jgi:anti-sigma factor RsiW
VSGGEQIEEMHCIEVVEIVSDYLERTLSETERIRVEAHLARCGGCQAYVAQMRQTVAAMRSLDDEAAPANLDSLVAAFRARHAR